MGFFTQFYLKPRLTILAVLVVLVGAFAAVGTLGRQEDPTLIERFGTIVINMPGASAEQIEAQITVPVEAALLELPEVEDLIGFSATGRAQFSIDIAEDLNATEVEEAWTEIRGQLDQARSELPNEVEAISINRIYVGAHTLVVNLQWTGEGAAPLSVLARLAEDLTLKLRNVPGTEFSEIYGLPQEEIRVLPNAEALAGLGLSVSEFAGLLMASDTKTPAGRIRTPKGNLTLEVSGAIESLERLENAPIDMQGQSFDGGVLRVKDIARIERGVQNPPSSLSMSNGNQSIIITAAISPGLRVDQWAARSQTVFDGFSQALPQNIRAEIIFDQNEYTSARLADLTRNLSISALIVFFVVWATMGLRGAVVVGSALPLTIACVLCVFLLTGKTLHQMSVTGLVIALGLLIDNAIVVVDEYDQMLDKGYTPREAIERVLKFLFAPLCASTLTTVLAFTPIAILPGSAGEFVGMIGFSVIAAVASSFLIALTIIPAFAGWLDGGPAKQARAKTWWRDGINLPIMGEGYRLVVKSALTYPLLALVVCLGLVGAGMYWSQFLPSQFFPATERDQLEISIDLPAESSVLQTQAVAQDVTDVLLQQDGITDVHLVIGEPSPRVYYNTMNLGEGFEGRAGGWIQFKTAQQARESAQYLQDLMTDLFPALEIRVTPFTQGPPVSAPLEIFVIGEDLEVLDDIGRKIRLILSETPGVTYTSAGLAMGAPVLMFEARDIDKALSGQSGLSLLAQLRAQSQGIEVARIQEDYQRIPVVVRAQSVDDLSLETILQTPLRPSDPAMTGLPLADLGKTTLKAEITSIVRNNGQRMNEIKAYLDPYHLAAPALDAFTKKLAKADLDLPSGYRIAFGGEAEASGETNSSLTALALPIFLVMLGAIALVFNSFRIAIIIMMSGFMSAGFAFAAIGFFNLPLGFNAIIGILSLLGIAINGSIVIAALMQADVSAVTRDIDGQVKVVMGGTRHIIATTLTTIGGFVPLLIQGDNFWMPFAAAIAGGAAGSAFLALVFTPVMFRLCVRNASLPKTSTPDAAMGIA